MEIDEAYEIVNKAEKALVTELIDLADSFNTRIAEIKAKQPTGGGTSVARQYLMRVEQNMNSIFTYDLDSVRNSYNMAKPAPTPTAQQADSTTEAPAA